METRNPSPPRLARAILEWFLKDELLEEVTGDLDEKFAATAKKKSLRRARLHYWFQVLNYFRPFAINTRIHQISMPMFRNYMKIGWRNLLRNKTYSIINISGLAVGLACAMAIGLFIIDEYSYDRFHTNAKNIYRVVQQQNQAGDIYDVASSPGPMGEALKADFPEVVQACLLGYKRSGVLQVGEVIVESSAITMADKGFLKMFDFPLIAGNPDKVFLEPHQVVITEQMAANLYGSDWMAKGILGKSVTHDKTNELVIVGVAKDVPAHSHIQFDVVLTFDAALEENRNWFSNNYHTYVQLQDGTDRNEFDRKLVGYIEKFRPPQLTTFGPPKFFLQPLTDIYLYSDFDFQTDWTRTSSIAYVRIFFAVGLVVLVIAIFNYINLSTARAIRRAKEVGIRKTVGAFYRQLMAQFLCESFLVTSIAVTLAFLLVYGSLPFLNGLSTKTLTLPFNEPFAILSLVAFTVTVSMLAGIYPSVYLSNFRPIKVLKGVFDVGSGRRFRQVLVATQFTFTVILVAGTMVIYKQLAFLRDKNLGFDQSQLLYISGDGLSEQNMVRLTQELREHTAIANAATASNSLIDVINSTVFFSWERKQPEDKFLITVLNTDPNYLPTTGVTLIAGRNFDPNLATDTASFLVNETAAKRMGWTPDEALGKDFSIWDNAGTIVGVVRDFHYRPLTTAIEPFVFTYRPGRWYDGVLVKAQEGQVNEALIIIQKVYKKYEPATPVHYSFVDQQLDGQYRYEQRTGKLLMVFSSLAILVACLGLFGLANFNAERRTKEIGIRKALGASLSSLATLLSKDFLLVVGMSIMIASPLSYLLARTWLQSFVYRVELELVIFVAAGGLALMIAGLTVGYQAMNAARANTVESLRSE